MGEKIDEKISRLRLMVEKDSKWDLSDNDIEAIELALSWRDRLDAVIDEADTQRKDLDYALDSLRHFESLSQRCVDKINTYYGSSNRDAEGLIQDLSMDLIATRTKKS